MSGEAGAVRNALDIVVLDTGIFAAGLFSEGVTPGRRLCPAIIAAACGRDRVFQTVLIAPVFDELVSIAARRRWPPSWELTLLEFLDESQADWRDLAMIPDRAAQEKELAQIMRHDDDARIAVEALAHRPDYIIHDNPEHWGRLRGRLGDACVVRPREYLRLKGLEVPPREHPKPRRKRGP